MIHIFNQDKPNRNVDYLFPTFKKRIQEFLKEAWQIKELNQVRIFEAYRAPIRQQHLYELGRTKPGKIVTTKTALNSWHQYGLAVDMAFLNTDGRWHWNGDWEKLIEISKNHGLKNLSPFEKAHFELQTKLTIKQANDILMHQGIFAVWEALLKE